MFNLLKKKLNSFIENIKKTKKIDERTQKKEQKLKAKLSIKTKIKAKITKEIELTEKELNPLLEELELSLIEADVEQNTAQQICNEIKENLVSKKIPAENFDEFVKKSIKETLAKLIEVEGIDLIEEIRKAKKPFVILFLGPNGSGKTTTIAKLAFLLQKYKLSSVIAASDTFRAASIEQILEHGKKLNIRVIKHQYGADPAAVAYDAIKAAEANKIDVVLIDTAGRQETNRNLIEELKKIERISKPNLKIFVGEAIAGQNLLNQVREFDDSLGIDAFILTKLDCDAKGGSLISLIYNLKRPVLFIGVGQNYNDLEKFDKEAIIGRIVA